MKNSFEKINLIIKILILCVDAVCINSILAAYKRGAKFFSDEGCLLLRSDTVGIK
jgi:hypothetical protein